MSIENCLTIYFAAIGIGFSVFMLSQVPSMVEFGLLMVVCVTTSFLASITLLPALVILAKPRFLGIRPLTTEKEHRVAA